LFTYKDGISYKETFSQIFIKDLFIIIMILVTHYDLELYNYIIRI
jgi:hypothetical protein